MLSVLLGTMLAVQAGAEPPGRGISETLARERAATIAALRYELSFTIPDDVQERVRGRIVVRFTLRAPHRVVLDFAEPREHVLSVRSGAAEVAFDMADGHLTIPAGATRAGDNEIAIDFVAGDSPLNRNPEFLYTLFVPARAHLAFPCFDQPDLKARYTLLLDVPSGWTAVSNGALSASEESGPRSRVRFAETAPISTYLFAFVAGKFSVETERRGQRELRMFHRETDAVKVVRNRDAVFDLHAAALAWLEDYTGIPYPFGKFDVIAIPSFQFSGMEHPGAILYNATSLLLEESATQNQMLDRASVVAHETAHMWFGDLVTMRWFNDVWMKEVFANFMAAKIVNPSFPEVNHDLRFLLAHYPGAYQVDRTAGTNPIRQDLANLDEAGQLYGPIIYQKAPIVMRQLEMIVGERAFRDGLREYLKTYSFGNATWLELVRILDARTPENLAAWSRAWVDERARPEFTVALEADRGRIARLTINMADPLERGLVWPQRLRVTLGYAGRMRHVSIYVRAHTTRVREVEGQPVPLFVLPSRWWSRLWAFSPGRRQPTLPAGAHRGHRRSADARERLADVVGQHARVARHAGGVHGCRRPGAARRDGRAERAARARLRGPRFLAPPAGGGSGGARASIRVDAARGSRSGPDGQREGRVVLGLQGQCPHGAERAIPRGRVAARRDHCGPDIRRGGRDRDGAGAGRAGGSCMARDPGNAARTHSEPRSESTVRVRHAGALRR